MTTRSSHSLRTTLVLTFAVLASSGVTLALFASSLEAASPTPSPASTPKATPKTTPAVKASASPTPKLSPSPESAIPLTNDASTTARLKDRIDRILEEQKQQVKGSATQVPSDATAIIGEVLRATERTLTLRAANTTETLTISKDVPLVKARRKITLEEVAVGDWVIGIGTRSTEGFLPTQVMVYAQSLRPRPHVTAFGTIKAVTRAKVDIQLASDQSIRTFQLDKDSVLEDNAGQPLVVADLDTDLQVLAVGFETNQRLMLKKLRLLVPTKGL
jgi:hypothetical protein